MTPRRPTAAVSFDTSAWITLRWTRGTRYFRAHLEQDLWQGWIVTHVNGRISSPLGRSRTRALPLRLKPRRCNSRRSQNAAGNAATP